jgi:hypothetical protein
MSIMFLGLLVVGVAGLAVLLALPTLLMVEAVRRGSRTLGWLAFGCACGQLLPGLVVLATANWLWTALLRTPATYGFFTLPCIVASIGFFGRVAWGTGRDGFDPRPALWLASLCQFATVVTIARAADGALMIPMNFKG